MENKILWNLDLYQHSLNKCKKVLLSKSINLDPEDDDRFFEFLMDEWENNKFNFTFKEWRILMFWFNIILIDSASPYNTEWSYKIYDDNLFGTLK